MEEQLIAPCGMNCALCPGYLAKKHDLRKKGLNRKYCPGCLPRGKGCTHTGHHCELLAKGEVRFCHECDKFPCAWLKSLDRRYRAKNHMSMIENLEHIKEHGLDSLLESEAAKWNCSECGDVICCQDGVCYGCGLDKLRQKPKYRWGEQ